jgi:hypothetical protein
VLALPDLALEEQFHDVRRLDAASMTLGGATPVAGNGVNNMLPF